VLASLVGFLGGDFALAEDAAADAFAIAAERWPRDGIPENPGAWLVRTARNRAIDRLRRERAFAAKAPLLARQETLEEPEGEDMTIPDERLELLFTCCHPALGLEAQVALTLRTLGGLDTDDIARAFLVTPETMKRRLTRARTKIKLAGIPFAVPPDQLLPDRLAAVMAVIYLIFNEGYSPPPTRTELAGEAIRLGRVLAELMPVEPEVLGLLGLMELHHARRAARFDGAALVLLADQDRALWDHDQIAAARARLDRALAAGGRGPFVLQAAIASLQSEPVLDWAQIAALYAELSRITGSPVVECNRAVAVAESEGAEAGLAILDGVPLDGYRYLFSTRAELLRRLERIEEARAAYRRALELTDAGPERTFLERRLSELGQDYNMSG
jgi:RNA polymerase sigma-70 factor (ECF subfamily)